MANCVTFESLEQIESWVELTCDRTRVFLDIAQRCLEKTKQETYILR